MVIPNLTTTTMNFFKKLGNFLASIFNVGFGFIKNHSFIAVAVTQNLKHAVEGQWDNRIASIIPGNWAPELVKAVEHYAPLVADKVLIAHNILQADKQSDSVAVLIEWLRGLSKHERSEKIADFAGRMNHYLADGTISIAEAWEEAQNVYFDFFKGK
jgi:hypothetical protein